MSRSPTRCCSSSDLASPESSDPSSPKSLGDNEKNLLTGSGLESLRCPEARDSEGSSGALRQLEDVSLPEIGSAAGESKILGPPSSTLRTLYSSPELSISAKSKLACGQRSACGNLYPSRLGRHKQSNYTVLRGTCTSKFRGRYQTASRTCAPRGAFRDS